MASRIPPPGRGARPKTPAPGRPSTGAREAVSAGRGRGTVTPSTSRLPGAASRTPATTSRLPAPGSRITPAGARTPATSTSSRIPPASASRVPPGGARTPSTTYRGPAAGARSAGAARPTKTGSLDTAGRFLVPPGPRGKNTALLVPPSAGARPGSFVGPRRQDTRATVAAARAASAKKVGKGKKETGPAGDALEKIDFQSVLPALDESFGEERPPWEEDQELNKIMEDPEMEDIAQVARAVNRELRMRDETEASGVASRLSHIQDYRRAFVNKAFEPDLEATAQANPAGMQAAAEYARKAMADFEIRRAANEVVQVLQQHESEEAADVVGTLRDMQNFRRCFVNRAFVPEGPCVGAGLQGFSAASPLITEYGSGGRIVLSPDLGAESPPSDMGEVSPATPEAGQRPVDSSTPVKRPEDDRSQRPPRQLVDISPPHLPGATSAGPAATSAAPPATSAVPPVPCAEVAVYSRGPAAGPVGPPAAAAPSAQEVPTGQLLNMEDVPTGQLLDLEDVPTDQLLDFEVPTANLLDLGDGTGDGAGNELRSTELYRLVRLNCENLQGEDLFTSFT